MGGSTFPQCKVPIAPVSQDARSELKAKFGVVSGLGKAMRRRDFMTGIAGSAPARLHVRGADSEARSIILLKS
jgi:hypothetical protein